MDSLWQKLKSIRNPQIVNNNSEDPIRMKNSDYDGEQTTATCSSQENQSTTQSSKTAQPQKHQSYRIGIYGWRKKCLYILILSLLVMVVVNLALTLWVLKVMEFSSDGMGQLKIVSGGLRLEGKAFVLDSLIASTIKSRTGQSIVLESSRNVTLKSRNKNGYLNSWVHLGDEQFECVASNFKIFDDRGMLLFSADRNEVVIGADTLKVSGEGGTRLRGSIQSNFVRAESGHELRLESPTNTLSIKAPKGITLESRGGSIETIAFNGITLKSVAGQIRLDSSSVVMPLLPTAKVSPRSFSSEDFKVYQLCVCESGKLFLASPTQVCASSNDDLLCR